MVETGAGLMPFIFIISSLSKKVSRGLKQVCVKSEHVAPVSTSTVTFSFERFGAESFNMDVNSGYLSFRPLKINSSGPFGMPLVLQSPPTGHSSLALPRLNRPLTCGLHGG